uniref:Uncharacterized protein n=1 Tax=Cacopsylla melanoneura TaxID=428564 RepID=A0A8D9AZD5_9HEMI
MIEVGIGKSGPHSLVRMNDCTLLLLTTDRMLGHSEFLIEFLWSVFIVAANLCISYGSSLYISYESYLCLSYGSYLCISYGSYLCILYTYVMEVLPRPMSGWFLYNQ